MRERCLVDPVAYLVDTVDPKLRRRRERFEAQTTLVRWTFVGPCTSLSDYDRNRDPVPGSPGRRQTGALEGSMNPLVLPSSRLVVDKGRIHNDRCESQSLMGLNRLVTVPPRSLSFASELAGDVLLSRRTDKGCTYSGLTDPVTDYDPSPNHCPSNSSPVP